MSARTETVRATFLAGAIIAGINVASLLLDQRDHAYSALMVVDIIHFLIAGTVCLLMRWRRPWSTRACDIAFIIATIPFTVGMWLPQTYDLHGDLVEPLLAHHFLLLGIAVVAPSWRSGVAMIAVFVGHALALSYVLQQTASSPALDREPWFSLVFGVFATMLLYTRARRRKLEQRLAAAEGRAQMLGQVSRVLLALRDRANTPLQNLEVAISLLEDGHTSPATVAMLRRSLERLVTIQRALSANQVPVEDLVPQEEFEVSLRDLLAADPELDRATTSR